jgi:hypothetical protein
VTPRITFIDDESLQNADGGGFSLFSSILERSRHWWSMRKHCAFGQKVSKFQIRVDAKFRSPEQLQDELVAEDNRRITLLGSHRSNFKLRDRTVDLTPHGPCRGSDKIARGSAQMTTPCDHIDQGFAKGFIEYRIV